ncbi:MAG TPA: DmsE family decaheme c-type cytochrome [Acidobacteriota bacterium]|nr:DmsE family decaheme c-type cytochrome [Acidobacteriota bacterium]
MERTRWKVMAAMAVVMVLAARPVLAQEAGAGATAARSATYVGSKACVDCHGEVVDKFANNPHHGSTVDGHVAGREVTCESCHGPGSLHVAAEGDEDNPGFRTVRNLKSMKAADANAVCASCHRTGEQLHWEQSAHANAKVACLDCHSVHDAKDPGGQRLLQAENATQQCVKCHHDKKTELIHTAHMPVREGAMTCADCHNPHGSPGPRMIRAVSNVDLCTSCHMDKKGPMLWEHPPVREDCVACHMPHGSNNDKVLAAKRPFLCQRCHVYSRHPSTLYDQPDLVSNRLFNRSCTNCHSQIHGSNHPSGKTFLR